jgi:DNA-binding beta-propeller fold protein YncE
MRWKLMTRRERSGGQPRGETAGIRAGAAAVLWRAGLLVALSACLWPSRATAAGEPKRLVWPAPPDAPRVAYERSLSGPGDFGVKRSTFAKVADWLVGTHADGEQFLKPFGIALDEQDNLCFTDTGANAVCCFDRARKKWRRWTQVGDLRFSSPVAVAKHGRTLFVADSGLGSVVVFEEEGKRARQITNGLQRPTGVAVLKDRLFVVDAQAQAVLSFDLEGRPAGQFGRRGSGPGEFNFPTHITATPDGNLLVTDSLNNRVQVLDASGHSLRQVGSIGDTPGHFSRPKGAAFDTFGHLYVVDANFDNVQLFDREGRLLMDLGQAGNQPGEFWLPNGIAISRDNQIYVTDCYNHRIQVFKFIGQP